MPESYPGYGQSARSMNWRRKYAKHKQLYLMLVPIVAYYLIFHYGPMYGAIIAFKQFSPTSGIFGSPWVGFLHFTDFFHSYYFWRLIRNTLMINVLDLVFGFPAPIILALLLNEITRSYFKRTIQAITYMPHFISIVVVAGLIIDFCTTRGLFNAIITSLGGKPQQFLMTPGFFQPLYVASGIWQSVGWGSIIYLAALSSIDQQLYEQAKVDGAGRFRQVIHITLPGMIPTIVVLLILRFGRMMSVGFEKVMLLYNPSIYETADVISTFVYRKGLLDMGYSFASAVGLFNSAIGLLLLVSVNWLSRRVSESNLW